MAIQIKPCSDRLTVRRNAAEEEKGQLIIPDNAQDKPQRGTVIAVGPGKEREDGTLRELPFSVGQEVLFNRWSPTEIYIDGEEILFLREDDVMGVVEQFGEKQ